LYRLEIGAGLCRVAALDNRPARLAQEPFDDRDHVVLVEHLYGLYHAWSGKDGKDTLCRG